MQAFPVSHLLSGRALESHYHDKRLLYALGRLSKSQLSKRIHGCPPTLVGRAGKFRSTRAPPLIVRFVFVPFLSQGHEYRFSAILRGSVGIGDDWCARSCRLVLCQST
jgi:hypothetical protein